MYTRKITFVFSSLTPNVQLSRSKYKATFFVSTPYRHGSSRKMWKLEYDFEQVFQTEVADTVLTFQLYHHDHHHPRVHHCQPPSNFSYISSSPLLSQSATSRIAPCIMLSTTFLRHRFVIFVWFVDVILV